MPERHRHYYIQRFVVDDAHMRSASSTLQGDYFFLHPALKELVRAERDPSLPWQPNTLVLIGDGLPFEPVPPLLHPEISEGQPKVWVESNGSKQPISASGRAGRPSQFLFLALFAWKLYGDGSVWPTIADINKIQAKLSVAFPRVKLPVISMDQSDSGSSMRGWAKSINKETVLKSLVQDAQARAPHVGVVLPDDRWRSGFITISAPGDMGAIARVAFPWLNPKDVYIDEGVLSHVRSG